MVELEHARELLYSMKLTTAAELLEVHLEQAVHREQTYLQFLDGLLSSEQMERSRKSQETRMKLSKLPHRKRLSDFDFAFQPSIDKRQIEELATLAFAARAENASFWGLPVWVRPIWLLDWH